MRGFLDALFDFVAGNGAAYGAGNLGRCRAPARADLAAYHRTDHAAGDFAEIAAFALDLDRVDRFDHAAIGAILDCPARRRQLAGRSQQRPAENDARLPVTQAQGGRGCRLGGNAVAILDDVSALIHAGRDFGQRQLPFHPLDPDAGLCARGTGQGKEQRLARIQARGRVGLETIDLDRRGQGGGIGRAFDFGTRSRAGKQGFIQNFGGDLIAGAQIRGDHRRGREPVLAPYGVSAFVHAGLHFLQPESVHDAVDAHGRRPAGSAVEGEQQIVAGSQSARRLDIEAVDPGGRRRVHGLLRPRDGRSERERERQQQRD